MTFFNLMLSCFYHKSWHSFGFDYDKPFPVVTFVFYPSNPSDKLHKSLGFYNPL